MLQPFVLIAGLPPSPYSPYQKQSPEISGPHKEWRKHVANISLSRILAHWTEIQPDRVAVDHEGDQRTWQQLEARTNRLARAYADLGVEQALTECPQTASAIRGNRAADA